MATEKQMAANRRNAARSTGPRTPEGKARSRMNALRHGLSSLSPFMNGDTDISLEAVFAGLRQVRLKRVELLARIDDLLATGDADAIDRGIKRLAALSRYEARMYSARRRRGS